MKLISQHAVVSILVKDQDEALHFYTEKLGLEQRRDITYGPGLRLLTVAAPGQYKPELALAQPAVALHGEERVRELLARIGHTAPWIFVTDNCCQEYETLLARGVGFLRGPATRRYGVEALFQDPSGNTFSLLEASPEVRSLFARQQIDTAA